MFWDGIAKLGIVLALIGKGNAAVFPIHSEVKRSLRGRQEILRRNLDVTPATVEETIPIYSSHVVQKLVTTDAIPPGVEVCILQDETGSFGPYQVNLKIAAPDIYDAVIAASPTATFGVAGFKDTFDNYVYNLKQSLTANKTEFTDGVNSLVASGGGDGPEGQYDAIVSAANGTPYGPDCGWAGSDDKTPVLIVTTDYRFSTDPDIVNDMASTTAALNAEGITLIGLIAGFYDGAELIQLAANTGGSTDSLGNNGEDIAEKILATLQNLPVTVVPNPVGCDGLDITFSPSSMEVISGNNATFDETIGVSDPEVAGTTITCQVLFKVNEETIATQNLTITVPLEVHASPDVAENELCTDNEHTVSAHVTSGGNNLVGVNATFKVSRAGEEPTHSATVKTDGNGIATFTYTKPKSVDTLGDDNIQACRLATCDSVVKTWIDTTKPVPSCVQGPNPDGVIPSADNQDGFWTVSAWDCITGAAPTVELKDTTGHSFGFFDVGTNIKYTQAPGGKPSVKDGDGAVDYKIKGAGDLVVAVTDSSGNVGNPVECHVPPGDNQPELSPITVHHKIHHKKADPTGVFRPDGD